MLDYLGLKVRHMEASEAGGASYLSHVGHAAAAIAAGKASGAALAAEPVFDRLQAKYAQQATRQNR
jgi:acetyl-CoA C-acetyltransferase